MAFKKKTWVDNVNDVSAVELNRLETGIEESLDYNNLTIDVTAPQGDKGPKGKDGYPGDRGMSGATGTTYHDTRRFPSYDMNDYDSWYANASRVIEPSDFNFTNNDGRNDLSCAPPMFKVGISMADAIKAFYSYINSI